jgi:hypothetical protein
LPAGERNHLRTKPHVFVVKRRLFMCGFSHAPN